MDDERGKIWRNIIVSILDNTIPEKKAETEELLGSFLQEMITEFKFTIDGFRKFTKE